MSQPAPLEGFTENKPDMVLIVTDKNNEKSVFVLDAKLYGENSKLGKT